MAAKATRKTAETKKRRVRRGSGAKEVAESRIQVQMGGARLTRELVVGRLGERTSQGKELRALFDEWRATGISANGEERPMSRSIAKARNAWERCAKYVMRNPPLFLLGDGSHSMRLSAPDYEKTVAALASGNRAAEAMAEFAVHDFIVLLSMPWCFEIARCAGCARYFAMARAPKERYPYGVHCPDCYRVQADKAAVAATQKARYLVKVERLALLLKVLKGWKEPAAAPDSESLLKKARREYPREVKRLGLSVNWITRNRKDLDRVRKFVKI